jgi:glycosyltransferase involved in cell wall biosynthesis
MHPQEKVPLSVVIPTRGRPAVVARVLKDLTEQSFLPAEIIVVDASADDATRNVVTKFSPDIKKVMGLRVVWLRAHIAGAAVQRNRGVAIATQSIIAFFDDDIIFESGCLAKLWIALQSDAELGGVNAMITNQSYQPPGRVSRTLFRILAGGGKLSYAGCVLGPGVNLLPEDREDLPEVVQAEWLNTTCTLYRREALPMPPFSPFFTGYSLMEDLALSVAVARHWKLANVRTARIYHDSQPGTHKNDTAALARMELVNRHYIMRHVLGQSRLADYGKFALWEIFQMCSTAIHNRCGLEFWRALDGKLQAIFEILSHPAGAATHE